MWAFSSPSLSCSVSHFPHLYGGTSDTSSPFLRRCARSHQPNVFGVFEEMKNRNILQYFAKAGPLAVLKAPPRGWSRNAMGTCLSAPVLSQKVALDEPPPAGAAKGGSISCLVPLSVPEFFTGDSTAAGNQLARANFPSIYS